MRQDVSRSAWGVVAGLALAVAACTAPADGGPTGAALAGSETAAQAPATDGPATAAPSEPAPSPAASLAAAASDDTPPDSRDACVTTEGGAVCNDAADPVGPIAVPTLRSNLAVGTYTAWRDAVLPTADETGWEAIPWLASFHEGVRVADAQDAPLLVWVMNGHPLGCT